MKSLAIYIFAFLTLDSFGQTAVEYSLDFSRRQYHELEISVVVDNLPDQPLKMNMSRSSPGRYALHEFAKNVYNVKAFDRMGNSLNVSRPDPHSWMVSGHDRFVKVTYTLFGDRGDGTYSEIDNSHAHMNIPATFMYPEGLGLRPIKVDFNLPENSGWKVATQLKKESETVFSAPNRYYFMDSPIEVSNFMLRSYQYEQNGKSYTIRIALHHTGTEKEADEYFESVKKITEEQRKVYGEFPDFDFGEYTFLACYMPGIDGDGMEHRNSTVVTSRRSLAEGGMSRNLGTISHEFFHAWNVERIRPNSLEPFDFQKANMSGELWFAEGFTSYYTGLILCRAGLISEDSYLTGLSGTINAVVNGTGRNFFTPIEMSYRAPFVDAARSVDPTNTGTIFISYYTYGSALGLALDLSLRNLDKNLSLDGYMTEVWNNYGEKEIPYEIDDLSDVLASYAGENFARNFFESYVYQSNAPDYQGLLETVGVELSHPNPNQAWMGFDVELNGNGWLVSSLPRFKGPGQSAGLAEGDLMIQLADETLKGKNPAETLASYNPGDKVKVRFQRGEMIYDSEITFEQTPSLQTLMYKAAGKKLNKEQKERRADWLKN